MEHLFFHENGINGQGHHPQSGKRGIGKHQCSQSCSGPVSLHIEKQCGQKPDWYGLIKNPVQNCGMGRVLKVRTPPLQMFPKRDLPDEQPVPDNIQSSEKNKYPGYCPRSPLQISVYLVQSQHHAQIGPEKQQQIGDQLPARQQLR